jgi:hypothetical protein
MTALQTIIKEAKSIKKAYPNRFAKWTDYVKQASAIYASKHKGKSPVGKKKAVKKTAKKKLVKKVGVVKKKVLKKSAPKKTAKKILKKHTHYGKVKSHMRRVNGVTKKPSEKDVLKSIQKAEKVQKSHMLINGISGHSMNSLKFSLNELHNYELLLTKLKDEIIKQKKEGKSKSSIISLNNWVKSLKALIKEQKLHITQLKKHI